jgi:uncharacterized protein
MRWVWDEAKNKQNQAKHGVSFEVAERVFGDPFQLSVPDPNVDEPRCRTIGAPSTNIHVLLLVVHTYPEPAESGDEVGRIISARRALPHERRAYEEGKF